MPEFEYALYNAFTNQRFGGSPAALVQNTQNLNADQMQTVAREFGVPATGFISAIENSKINVRFFSTQTEYPMCGHGTIALATWLVERKEILLSNDNEIEISTPASSARLYLQKLDGGSVRVEMALAPAQFEEWSEDNETWATLLNIKPDAIDDSLPVGFTDSDFRHLIVPFKDISYVKAISPNLDAIRQYCLDNGVDTLMVFCPANNPNTDIHCREFCPAVGTSEAAASGTTNRALACYLHQFKGFEFPVHGRGQINVEQGIEMGRPSQIFTQINTKDGEIEVLYVGGTAVKTHEGRLFI